MNNDPKHAKTQRIVSLDNFMKEYLSSEDKLGLYEKNKELLESIQPLDLFEVAMYREDTFLDVETIKKDAGKFVNLFRHGLEKTRVNFENCEFLRRLVEENNQVRKHLDTIKPMLSPNRILESRKQIIVKLEDLEVLKLKFIKLQNVLFPLVETSVSSKMPLVVLWSIHDDVETTRKALIGSLKEDNPSIGGINRLLGLFYYQLTSLMEKEELILFPTSYEVIPTDKWSLMLVEANRIGYAFGDPGIQMPEENTSAHFDNRKIVFPTGELTIEQLDLIFSHLPYALTYVDENDTLRYYNDTLMREFPRTPQVIGRKVELCHPQKSVAVVKEIIEAFRTKKQDEAIFWFDHHGKKIHVAYLALRDQTGKYRGVLEISSDISSLIGIKGERRLLDWEKAGK